MLEGLKKKIDVAVSKVVQELKKMAVPIDNDIEKIRNVATVSANNDKVILSDFLFFTKSVF